MSSARRIAVIVAHELRLARRDPLSILCSSCSDHHHGFPEAAFSPALVQSGHPHANGAEQVVRVKRRCRRSSSCPRHVRLLLRHGWSTWIVFAPAERRRSRSSPGRRCPASRGVVQSHCCSCRCGRLDLRIRGDALALVPCSSRSACAWCSSASPSPRCFAPRSRRTRSPTRHGAVRAIGGAFVPFNLLRDGADHRAGDTDYWAMRGMRSVILDGRGIGGVALPIAALLGMELASHSSHSDAFASTRRRSVGLTARHGYPTGFFEVDGRT